MNCDTCDHACETPSCVPDAAAFCCLCIMDTAPVFVEPCQVCLTRMWEIVERDFAECFPCLPVSHMDAQGNILEVPEMMSLVCDHDRPLITKEDCYWCVIEDAREYWLEHSDLWAVA